jgi:hypothetical protein
MKRNYIGLIQCCKILQKKVQYLILILVKKSRLMKKKEPIVLITVIPI